MPGFVYSPLLWGLLLVGVPVLIHLINMLRHRRVEWAAMEFLLASQKKNRTWIVLKQLLLLLLRMVAVATVVLMVAKPRPTNWLGDWFGSRTTHHIVLLDDSFSMSDRWADTSAMGEALAVIRRIEAEAARQVHPQTFTLLRFSRVAQLEQGTRPDFWDEPVNADLAGRLGEALDGMAASESSAGPADALDAVGQLVGDQGDQRRIVYLVSDFRARQWNDPTDLKKQLAALDEADTEIHLINCVDREQDNLAITSLAPAEGIKAAGVQFFMTVAVKNFGLATARDVSVSLVERETSDAAADDGRSRPAVTIKEIPPGQTVEERLRVYSPAAGEHLLGARLATDPVVVDNARYAAVDLPVDVPVLLVDGSPEVQAARFVSYALDPGGPVRTGIRPQIETPRYLSLKPLDEFGAITLLDVDWLDESAVTALEDYLRAGGGVAVFLGERSAGATRLINDRFYRQGEGFFPVPLREGEAQILPVSRIERTPDLQVTEHPIFRILAGSRNGFVSMVIVQRYLAVPDDWNPAPDSTVRVIARLRNGAPLAIERRFGEGRVVVFLTTAAPVWNNWARDNPSFVVAMQDLHAYLAERSVAGVSRRVGSPLELEVDEATYDKQVRFLTPKDGPGTKTLISANPTTRGTLTVSLPDTERSGIYQVELRRNDGAEEVRGYAYNVDAEEGDLRTISGAELAARLEGVAYDYQQAAAVQVALADAAGGDVGEWFLYLLVAVLVGEQILAWSAGYHPPGAVRNARATGGAR